MYTFPSVLQISPVRAQVSLDQLGKRIGEIQDSRSRGRYREAIEFARSVVEDTKAGYEMHKRAYRELVRTYLDMGDIDRAKKMTAEANERFSTLEPLNLVKGEMPADEQSPDLLTDAAALRSNRQWEEAVQRIDLVIAKSQPYYDTMKHGYNELVKTYCENPVDTSGSSEAAREALIFFPTIRDEWYNSTPLDRLYESARGNLYGSIRVNTKPEESKILVDGEFRGFSPVTVNYVQGGIHKLTAEKTGRKTVEDSVTVVPGNLPVDRGLELPRAGLSPWIVVPVHVVLTTLAIVMALVVADRGEEQPLPDPPSPPGN